MYTKDGDIMRVYFLFDVKDEFINLYKDNERVLFNILRQIYYLQKEEVKYGYNLFSQLTNRIDNTDLDKYIYIKLHQNIPYSKREKIHYFNNLYRDEISRLIVKKSYIKLEAEQINSSFFKVLNDYCKNFFVCEFKYQDYFFLDDILSKNTV